MTFVNGRILVTDCQQDDRENLNAVIGNILFHSSSRAEVYVLLKNFKNVKTVQQKFPAVIPVVVDPINDINNTRQILQLLPRMNHFVNLLGDHLAREFAGNDNSFRIKTVSFDYIKDSKKIIEKILESDDKQGIIFNVSENETSQFVETNTMEKVFKCLKTSFRENKNKNVKKSPESPGVDQESRAGPSRGNQHHVNNCNTATPSRSTNGHNYNMPSIFGYCFPHRKTQRAVPLNPNQYPSDLDDKLKKAFQHLHKKAAEKWRAKSEKLVKKDSNASLKVERKVEKWKSEELPNALAKVEMDNQRTLERSFDPELKEKIIKRRHDSANAEVEREGRKLMNAKKNTLEAKLSYSVVALEQEHYEYLIRKQISLLNDVWQGGNGSKRFSLKL